MENSILKFLVIAISISRILPKINDPIQKPKQYHSLFKNWRYSFRQTNITCSIDSEDTHYIEDFKATINLNPKYKHLKIHFDNAVDLNAESILFLKREKIFDIYDNTYEPKLLEIHYNDNDDILGASDPETWMRQGGKEFRKKEAEAELINVLKKLEADYKFFPKTLLELGAGQGRLTKEVDKYYQSQNKYIDVLEPFEPMLQFLRQKNLSKVRNIFVKKFEEFFCEFPMYDFIYGFFVNVYVSDKDLPKLYLMLRSCLKKGGLFYFKDHMSFGKPKVIDEGQKTRQIIVFTLMMNLFGMYPISIAKSFYQDELYKKGYLITGKLLS